MDNVPITLIIKAPNQQIEDVQVQCELSWTIRRLKGYLSEVYPLKPSSEEQKLIYSGRLLNDTVKLKDILRQYDGQNTHTVHLVFTPKNSGLQMSNAKVDTSHQNLTSNTDGLRQRSVPTTNIYSETVQQSTGTTGLPSPSSSSSSLHMNPYAAAFQAQMQIQMGQPVLQQPQGNHQSYEYLMAQQLQMQQVYIQYMNQYLNAVQQANNTSTLQNGLNPMMANPFFMNNNSNNSLGAPVVPQQQQLANQQLEQQQQQQQQPVAQAVRNVQPEEGERLDWLDMFYVCSRLMVLITLIYFYSSPTRFMIVIFFTVLYYLYHIGFFRQANVEPNNNRILRPNEQPNRENNNNNNHPQQQQVEPNDAAPNNNANAVANNNNNNNDPLRNGNDDDAAANESLSSAGNGDVAEPEQNNRIPVIAILRTFVLSFFASLIPETPAL